MDFSISGILASFVFGVFAFFIFRDGKKEQNIPKIAIGITLFILPFLVTNPWVEWPIGLSLVLVAYKFVD